MTAWEAIGTLFCIGGALALFASIAAMPPATRTQRRIALGVLAVGVLCMLPLFARLWVAALLGGA